MKFLLISFLLLSSSLAFARSCENEVLEAYKLALPQNEWHSIIGKNYIFKSGENDVLLYGTKITLRYPVDTKLFLASSEHMGGFGVEAIVVDADCSVLELFNVYTE